MLCTPQRATDYQGNVQQDAWHGTSRNARYKGSQQHESLRVQLGSTPKSCLIAETLLAVRHTRSSAADSKPCACTNEAAQGSLTPPIKFSNLEPVHRSFWRLPGVGDVPASLHWIRTETSTHLPFPCLSRNSTVTSTRSAAPSALPRCILSVERRC